MEREVIASRTLRLVELSKARDIDAPSYRSPSQGLITGTNGQLTFSSKFAANGAAPGPRKTPSDSHIPTRFPMS